MRWLFVVALASCGGMDRDDGDSCKDNRYCRSNLCVHGTCSSGQLDSACVGDTHCKGSDLRCDVSLKKCVARANRGESCDSVHKCASALRCLEGRCRDDQEQKAIDEKRAAEKRKADAVREAQMLEQAGVPAVTAGSGHTAERPVYPPGPGARVRTVTITSKESAIAACKAEERLVGGGCKADPVLSSYPSGQSDLDTVGARWNCHAKRNAEVTAYALCTKLP